MMKMDVQKLNSVKNSPILRIIKIVLFTALLCWLMCSVLSWYLTTIPETVTFLEGESMPNTVWLVKYGSVALPLVAVATVLTLLYKITGEAPFKTQVDKAVIVGCVFAFTYFVILPAVLKRSPEWWEVQMVDEVEVKTLFERSAIWFFAQMIPFLITLSYHIYRASSEKRELAEIQNENDNENETENENENEE